MPNPQIRTLILTEKPLYPPMGGAALRNWQNVNILKRFGSVGVFYLLAKPDKIMDEPAVPPGLEHWSVHKVRQRTHRQKIERRLQMVKWLLTRTAPLTNMFYCPQVARELEQLLNDFQPDLVVIEEIWMYCYLFIIKQHSCRVVYDAHNAEATLFRQIFGSTSKKTLRTKINETTKLAFIAAAERDLIEKVDQIWACSEHDTLQLQSSSARPISISVVPNSVNIAQYRSVYLNEHPLPKQLKLTSHTLIFTASFGYRPNGIAAEWLLKEIYPRLSTTYPNCCLLLVGKDPTQQMQIAAEKNPNIIVTGVVPDVRPYLAAANVVVVPLQQGSGTRLKILEAFACGRPVISTSKGVEGFDAVDGVHLLIRDDVEDFAKGISCLWEEVETRQKLAQAAYELVQTAYSWEAAAEKLRHTLKQVLPNCLPAEKTLKTS